MSPEWNEEYEKDYDVVGKYGKMFTKIMRAYIKGLPKESYLDDCPRDNENGNNYLHIKQDTRNLVYQNLFNFKSHKVVPKPKKYDT
jgi:hypothetical protein